MANRADGLAVETPNDNRDERFLKWRTSFVAIARFILKAVMGHVFIEWVILVFIYPAPSLLGRFLKLFTATGSSFYGLLGSFLWMFSAHPFILALLAAIYLMSSPPVNKKDKKSKFKRFQLSTCPALVSGPFGVVSAAELIGILIVVVFIVWASCAYNSQNHHSISNMTVSPEEKSHLLMEYTGYRLGTIGMFVVTLLFIPISRGSVLLRLINVPFEQATRYHIWLGHLTMAIFTLHGLCYMISWGLRGDELSQTLLSWNKHGISIFPGLVSLVVGLLMWVTTLDSVRRKNFELFFYTHQLYVVFVIFFALHVGDFLFSVSSGPIFLFMLDRFLRFCQSRRRVRLLSATSLPCGAMELVLSKPRNLQYNALSFIFLKVKEISQLEWHPFSVSSSPMDSKNHLSVVVKGLGQWTKKLRNGISSGPEEIRGEIPLNSGLRVTTSVEGPYGHGLPHHMKYEQLIFVAGGIGITPFLAVLSDVLHQIKDKKTSTPKQILLVWAIKRSQELSLLSLLDTESICPSFSESLHLQIQTYVTQESGPQLEDGNVQANIGRSIHTDVGGKPISSLVATGNNIWSGVYVVVPICGFFGLLTLMKAFVMKPHDITPWWFEGLMFVICMVVSVIVFGGIVIFLWNLWERKVSGNTIDGRENSVPQHRPRSHGRNLHSSLVQLNNIQYGVRPNFQVIFNNIVNRWEDVDVGVIVCGPPNLNSSVAEECRRRNLRSAQYRPIFHFHNHSFEL